jgi:hypothetical protein
LQWSELVPTERSAKSIWKPKQDLRPALSHENDVHDILALLEGRACSCARPCLGSALLGFVNSRAAAYLLGCLLARICLD